VKKEVENIAKQKLESMLKGRFMSIALLSSQNNHTKQLPAKYAVNEYILHDKHNKTIKTCILHIQLEYKPNSYLVNKYILKGLYDYSKYFDKRIYNSKHHTKLHELIYYKIFMSMLINNEKTKQS
jgi:hypothetical protein